MFHFAPGARMANSSCGMFLFSLGIFSFRTNVVYTSESVSGQFTLYFV
jgi:hypothetical protein